MATATQPVYHTKWESLPASLRPPQLTTCQKVWRVVWNILSVFIPIIGLIRLAAWGLGILAHRLILPGMYHSEWLKDLCHEQFERVCQSSSGHYEITPHTIVTPDGAELSVHLFRSRKGDAQTPTTIYFGGNGQLKGMSNWSWVLQDSISRNVPMNLVLFHYRSVDDSKGKFATPKDLLVDGSSVVQWVRDVVKTPAPQIHFYGLSLGGAVALKTKAADEKLTGNLLHERSFSSLEDWIGAFGDRLGWFMKPLIPIARCLLKSQDFDLNAAADLEKLKGRIIVVYHPQDPVIPYPASMARKVPQHAFELKERYFVDNHHCSALTDYHDARRKTSDFIFAAQ